MTEAERAIYTLILVGGTVALVYGAFSFIRGRFTVLTLVGFRRVDGLWATVISLLDVLLGTVAIVYAVVGLVAPDSGFAATIDSFLGLPERGTSILELANGDTIDLNPAVFYLAWGFWQGVLSLSPFVVQRLQQPDK
jgi:hypothetical protein